MEAAPEPRGAVDTEATMLSKDTQGARTERATGRRPTATKRTGRDGTIQEDPLRPSHTSHRAHTDKGQQRPDPLTGSPKPQSPHEHHQPATARAPGRSKEARSHPAGPAAAAAEAAPEPLPHRLGEEGNGGRARPPGDAAGVADALEA